jgi:hypothetical protein
MFFKKLFLKAYLEFFTSADNIPALRAVLKNFPSVNYHLVNKSVRISLLYLDFLKEILFIG